MAGGKSILLVEDDDALRDSLVEQLKLHEEFETIAVESGAQALEQSKEQHFELLILDVGLPDMDGRELCRLLRRGDIEQIAETEPFLFILPQIAEGDVRGVRSAVMLGFVGDRLIRRKKGCNWRGHD